MYLFRRIIYAALAAVLCAAVSGCDPTLITKLNNIAHWDGNLNSIAHLDGNTQGRTQDDRVTETKSDYITTRNSKCKVINLYPGYLDQVSWVGKCEDGYANGYGTVEWLLVGNERSYYKGEMRQGKFEGKGILGSNTGDRYEGEFKDGKADGQGVFEASAHRYRYEGEFRNGKKNGKGSYTMKNGEHYEGEFIGDKKNGKGILILSNGNGYVGQFKDDHFAGGIFTGDYGRNETTQEDIKEFARECARSKIKEHSSGMDESSTFYGVCNDGVAFDGIVVWNFRDVPYDIGCVRNGKLLPDTQFDAFSSCKRYLILAPNLCWLEDGYVGQCKNGVPDGVGYRYQRGVKGDAKNTTGKLLGGLAALSANMSSVYHTISKGMFVKGQQDGYGFYASAYDCGPVGCSGGGSNERGWFEAGKLKTKCDSIQNCAQVISGRGFAQRFAHKAVASSQPQDDSFDGLLARYRDTGDTALLSRALALADTPARRADVEYTTLRSIGYDRVMPAQLSLTINNKAISSQNNDAILKILNNTSSTIPVTVKMSIGNDQKIFALKYGSYRAQLKVGAIVTYNTHSCSLGACTDSDSERKFFDNTTATLSPKGYRDQGQFEIKVSGPSEINANGGFANTLNASITVTAIKPFSEIDSVELIK